MAKKYNLSKGLTAGICLFLFFTISFMCVGYRVAFCTGLGFLGGLAGFFVAAWWQNDEKPSQSDTSNKSSLTLLFPNVVTTTLQSDKKKSKLPTRSSRRAVTLLDWVFRSNRR